MTRDIALLTNPGAGGGTGARRAAEAIPVLRAAGFGVRNLRGPTAQDVTALGQAALADGAEAIVVCGGDGMVHLGVQLVAGTDTPLGIIPAGTGNDVARYLGLPQRDGRAAAEAIARWHPRTIDLAHSDGRWFATVLAAGFDARVNERANTMAWPKGQMRYNLATLAELRTFTPLAYTLELDGRTHEVEAMLVAVGNGPSYGGGLRIAEGARLDDGLLDVVIIKTMSKLDLLRTFPKLFHGTHVTHHKYEHHGVGSVTVAGPDLVAYADGERFAALPLTVEAVPGALRVLSLP